MKARAVIGANFGDEGKGLMTDYLVNKHQSDLVVRFNGGGQAGHTVTTPDGRRHVFSHFGSGAFTGAATLLSRFFIVNPLTFIKERKELALKAPVNLTVKIDINASVSTPFDMLLNQMVEQKRGGKRHGSCGLGIGETIERGEQFFNLTMLNLTDEWMLRNLLLKIRDVWVPIRKAQLGLSDDFDHIIYSDDLIENYLSDVRYLLNNTESVNDVDVIKQAFNPIFEGAQGLLLDQDHEYFPHVTRSSTGIKNVLKLIGANFEELEVVYMTRSYLTRHGAGPLKNELSEKPFEKIVDQTNIPNDWQGTLRFAYLDLDLLKKTIINDLLTNHYHKITPSVGITCLDQSGDLVPVYHDGEEHYLYKGRDLMDAGDQIAKRLGIGLNHFKSYGPTREDVKSFQEEGDAYIELRSNKANMARANNPNRKPRTFKPKMVVA